MKFQNLNFTVNPLSLFVKVPYKLYHRIDAEISFLFIYLLFFFDIFYIRVVLDV